MTRRRSGLAAATALLALLLGVAPASVVGAESGLGTPSWVSVERSDGSLTASWPAVGGATHYHITYSPNGGQSWLLASLGHAETSISVSGLDNSSTYVVGVRAGNSSGWGGWRNSEPAGPWTPPPPPAVPSWVSVERSDGVLDVSWPAVAGADSYHVTYTSDGGQSWQLAAFDHPSSSVVITGVENADTYIAAVRARSAGGWGGWANSSAAEPWLPPPAAVSSVAVARAPGVLEVSWPAVAGADSYHVTYTSDGGQSWQLAAFGHPSAGVVITGVQDGTDYIVGVRARNAGGWSGWTNSPVSSAYDPSAAPGGLAVKPGDGYLDLSWDAVSGATGYDVRAKAEGAGSWYSVAGAVTATSYRYTTDATIDHVAVRVRNAGGAGAWAEKSRMPSEDLWTAVTGDTAGGESGAQGLVSAASAQSQSGQLGSPVLGDITRRSHRARYASMEVNWTGVTGADGYNFVCSSYGWYWHACGHQTGDSANPVSYGTVPTTQGQPLTISHYKRTSGWGTPGEYRLSWSRAHTVAVRAVKTGDPSAAGPWVRSETTRPAQPVDGDTVAFTRGDGRIAMTWEPAFFVTGYEIYCGVYNSGQATALTRCATLSGVNYTDAQHTATISTWDVTDDDDNTTSYAIDNTKTYDIRIVSINKWGESVGLAPLMEPITLTASQVGRTTARLTLANYTGAWWLKPTTPANASCESMGTATAAGSAGDVSGLTPGGAYIYKAYSDSACTDEIVSASSFTTTLTTDYDSDDDKLIEVSTLAQLNAVRWDADGDGLVTGANQSSYRAAFPHATAYTGATAMGCPSTCEGYELAGDLDFDTNGSGTADSGDTYWNSGSGWSPISDFNADFDGNGRIVSNLFVSRDQSWVGLFARVLGQGDIADLTLDSVDVTASTTSVTPWAGALAGKLDSGATVSGVSVSGTVDALKSQSGNAGAGGVVGDNAGTVSHSHSSAAVKAEVSPGSAGNLVDAGGIAGRNGGSIAASWFSGTATAAVTGSGTGRVGGIAGAQTSGSIKASYSTGTSNVSASLFCGGGIVGCVTGGTVQAAYAAGRVLRGGASPNLNQFFHGVAGLNNGGTVTDSYYDKSKITGVLDTYTGNHKGLNKTTIELQSPTDYTGIYANWNLDLDGVTGGDDPWDFGTASEYPVLPSAPKTLTASSIITTAATLTIANHNGGWWHQGDQSGATCTAVSAGTKTASLASLTASTTYTYTAYSDSSCTTEIAAATFTTTAS